MNEERRKAEALFRYAVLGDLLHRSLRRGELGRALAERAHKLWKCPDGRERRIAKKTLEEWYYRYKKSGFDGLQPSPRSDRGKARALNAEIEELVIAMKREDPGRSAQLILEELEHAGRLRRGEVSVSTIRRVLKREGLTGPRMELERPARLRWQATRSGELWQGDALHGPNLFDPTSGRAVRVKIFALLDDRSRLVPYVRADFHETQTAFLTVLLGAVLRRGIPRAILLDNHGSFTGSDVRVACAKLGVRLVFARPHDGASKGKIERWWRTLRARVLDRLDPTKVSTLDDLNVRLSAWVEAEYNARPHSSLGSKTPLEVWEEDAEEVRWVDDPGAIEEAFTDKLKRKVRDDSTCQVGGRTLEVPTELRGRSVEICYSLLQPDRYWVEDGHTQIPLREVNPEENAHRPRQRKPLEKKEERPVTDLYPIGYHPDRKLWEFVQLRTGSIPDRREDGELEYTEESGVVLVLLPGGSFLRREEQGEEQNNDPEANEDAKPIHKIQLSPFLIGKYEVTQEIWERVMGFNPSGFSKHTSRFSDGICLPVEMVSWCDCEEFLEKTGLDFHSEAQWEYACRGGEEDEKPYSLGESITTDQANFNGNFPCAGMPEGDFRRETVPVDFFEPNDFGLYQMHGNVWEWCKDIHAPFPVNPGGDDLLDPVSLEVSENVNPNGLERINRGGSWNSKARNCRSSHRDGDHPRDRTVRTGLRPCLMLK